MNDKTFVISNPNKHRVGGIQIKENTEKRRMEFTTNDFAYTCDIDALHNKIDTLHEQIEKNDTALATTLNELPTVDEVNEALEKVKSEIPAPVDLTNYALKTQITELQNRITTLESRLAALEQNGNQGSAAGDLSAYATKAVIICDDNGFNACEITSAILEEGITLATNNDLANYYSKDDLTDKFLYWWFGLNEFMKLQSDFLLKI